MPCTSDEPTGRSDEGQDGVLRLRLELAYDGGPFSGWARQPGLLTVQGCLEAALELVVRERVSVTVAGRTDAGVHARAQVAHLDVPAAWWRSCAPPAEARALYRLQRALHRVLGSARQGARGRGALLVRSLTQAPAGFDARFSALSRRYSYRIADSSTTWEPLSRAFTWWYRGRLSVDSLNEAGACLVGLRDFYSFSRPRPGASTIRELQQCHFTCAPDGVILAHVQADAFCHGMVRGLLAALTQVASGQRPLEWLMERQASRQRQGRLFAPAHPLVLEEVRYPEPAFLLARAEQTRARRSYAPTPAGGVG